MSAPRFILRKNLTFIGAPGSGKGFYGRPLAEHFQVPLLTASSILRQQVLQDVDLDSGKLVDCQRVSNALLNYLSSEMNNQHYILDGFPRTMEQIELMKTQWPKHLQVHAAFHLDIPDFVCEQKVLGRRHCEICGKGWNIAGVYESGFDLPPQLPTSACERCDPDKDWTQRADDTPAIVQERLREYRQHEKPIIEYYQRQGRLLSITVFKGDRDIPLLKKSMEELLGSFED